LKKDKKMNNLRCEKCGDQILVDDNFCTSCGSDIAAETEKYITDTPLEDLLRKVSTMNLKDGNKLIKVIAPLIRIVQNSIKNYYVKKEQKELRKIHATINNYISDFERFLDLYDDLFGEGIYKPEEYIKGFGKYKLNAEWEVRQEGQKHPLAYTHRAMELFLMVWLRYDMQGRINKPVKETERKKMTRELMLLSEKYPEGNRLALRYRSEHRLSLDKLLEWEKQYYYKKDGDLVPREKHLEIDVELVNELAGFHLSPEEINQGKLHDHPDFNKSTIRENQSTQSPFEELMEQVYKDTTEKGNAFEYFCATLLSKMGYKIEQVAGGSGDRGVDISIETIGAIKTKIAVQCKHYPDSSKINSDVIQKAMSAKLLPNESFDKSIVMTSGFFTSSATKLANEADIELFDYNEIKKLYGEYLSDFENLQEIEKYGRAFRKT